MNREQSIVINFAYVILTDTYSHKELCKHHSGMDLKGKNLFDNHTLHHCILNKFNKFKLTESFD